MAGAAEAWKALAGCKGVPPSVFFSERPHDVLVAKNCCRTCPVSQPCREHARANGEYGTWGTETESERSALGYRPSSVHAVALAGG